MVGVSFIFSAFLSLPLFSLSLPPLFLPPITFPSTSSSCLPHLLQPPCFLSFFSRLTFSPSSLLLYPLPFLFSLSLSLPFCIFSVSFFSLLLSPFFLIHPHFPSDLPLSSSLVSVFSPLLFALSLLPDRHEVSSFAPTTLSPAMMFCLTTAWK